MQHQQFQYKANKSIYDCGVQKKNENIHSNLADKQINGKYI